MTVQLPAGSRIQAKAASINNTLNNNGITELDIHATTSQGDITAHSL